MRNNPAYLKIMCCPKCGGALEIHHIEEEFEQHIITGQLVCQQCQTVYPIRKGVPRFLPPKINAQVAETVDGFGYEWKYSNQYVRDKHFSSEDVFLDFLVPVEKDIFTNKVILDAGCGAGRFTWLSAQWSAELVVGVDLSESVEVAFENTRDMPNVFVLQADLFNLPLRQEFDYVFSIGVLHHTADPRGAFGAIVKKLKPGGSVSAWVYSRENNDWVINVVNPIRQKITSRLNHRLLRVLAYLLTVPIFLVSKLIYRPVGRIPLLSGLKRLLFYYDYIYFFGSFGYHEQALIVFDHLVPSIAEYIPRQEFENWFKENNLNNLVITSRAGNSWRGFAGKPSLGDTP